MLRARIPLALAVGAFVLLLSADASARPEVVTWSHDSPCDIDGFELRIGPTPDQVTQILDVGRPRQAGGHFSYSLELDDDADLYICVAAHRGGLTGECSNQLNLAPSTVGTTRSVPAPRQENRTWCEDFNQGTSPGWVHTGPNDSLERDPSLFSVENVGGENYALSTTSEQPSVHSHFLASDVDGVEARLWSAYEYSGEMRFADDGAGIGVTIYSLFDSATGHYRLGRDAQANFELTRARIDPSFRCTPTAAEVPVLPNVWFSFRVRVHDTGQQIIVEGKVWRADEREPEGFQSTCTDSDSARPPSGAIGVWSDGPGQKWWDNLSVSRIESESGTDPLGIPGRPELTP